MKTATERAETPEPSHLPVDDTTDVDPPSTNDSWVDRCQRQFGGDDRRLRNLADNENCAFYDGV